MDNLRLAALFDKYGLPDWLRQHLDVVREAARELALALQRAGEEVDVERVTAAAWLHDIGKSPLFASEPRDHAELSAEILTTEGFPELAEMARRHIVFAILDPARAPRTLAEKIVYYADRRGGMEIVSIDERLREQAERFPASAADIARCLAPAQALERELFAKLPFRPEDLCAKR